MAAELRASADVVSRPSWASTRGPIRVARVIARLNVGGPAIHVTTLTARLPRERFESRLFAGHVSPGEAEMVEVLDREGVVPVRIRGLGRALRAHHDLLALRQLVMHFRQFRPHVVHTHTAKAGALGRLAARLCRVPVVVHTFHGHVFEGYFSRPLTQGFLAIERLLARASSAIVTISPRQYTDITDRYRIAGAGKTVVIPLGFDLTRFAGVRSGAGGLRRELGIGEVPIVASVGRLTSIKDHALLFRAFAAIDGTGAHLCVVGGGELEHDLRALAVQLGIDARTHFLGFRSDLESILADTDVVALTSLNEGTPVALVEALAAGCSVVGVDVGGVCDVLADGKWGRLVRGRSPHEFAEVLRQALMNHRHRSSEAIEAARSYARQKYGIDRLVREHVSLYEALLARTARTQDLHRAPNPQPGPLNPGQPEPCVG